MAAIDPLTGRPYLTPSVKLPTFADASTAFNGDFSPPSSPHSPITPGPIEMPADTAARAATEQRLAIEQQNANRADAQFKSSLVRQERRMRAEDLQNRTVASYTDAAGNPQPVRDATGAALTHYDKDNNIAWDSSGQPKKLSYGESGPPALNDPLANLLPTTDKKTGDKYLTAPGLPTQWAGKDPAVAAQLEQKARDKAVNDAAAVLGRGLTAEERDLVHSQHDLSTSAKQFAGAIGLEPDDLGGMDNASVAAHINRQFDPANYPEANRSAHWYGGGLAPEAQTLRQQLAEQKTQALANAQAHFTKADAHAQRQTAVQARREQQRALQGMQLERANAGLQQAGVALPVAPIPGVAAGGAGENSDMSEFDPAELMLPEGDADPAASLAPVSAMTPAAPDQPRAIQPFNAQDAPYKVDEQGQINFDPARLSEGLLAAHRAGLVDDAALKEILPKALDAEKAAQAQQAGIAELQAKQASAGNFAGAKAAAFGAAKGAGFLAAAAPGAAAGAELGALGGPLAPITVPAGSIIGGLITGTLGSMAVEHGVKELGKHSDAIKSFADASDLHPYYDAAGNLLAFGAGLPKAATSVAGAGLRQLAGEGESVAARLARGTAQHYENSAGVGATVRNLAEDASIRAASGASKGQIATAIGARVGGAAAANVAIDTAIKEGARALGFSDQGQTLDGATQAALIGAFTAGHGIKVEGYSGQQIASIATRAKLRKDAGLAINEGILEPDQMPPGIDSAMAAALSRPLSAKEAEVFERFGQEVTRLRAEGKLSAQPSAEELVDVAARSTARQGTVNGRPYGVTALDVAPSADRVAARTAPESAPLLPASSSAPVPPPEPVPAPASSAAPSNALAAEPEAPSSSPVTAGEVNAAAQQPDDEHRALAERVNSGAESEVDGERANIPFQVLARLKQGGAEINADVARTIGEQARAIVADPASDNAAKQTALQRLVRDNLPAQRAPIDVEAQDVTPSAPPAPAENVTYRTQNEASSAPSAPADQTVNTGNDPAADATPEMSPIGDKSASTLAELTRARDDQQLLLDAGKISPEAEPHTRALVQYLDERIAALRGEPQRAPVVTQDGSAPAVLGVPPSAEHGAGSSAAEFAGEGERSSFNDKAQDVPAATDSPAPLAIGDRINLARDGKTFHVVTEDDGGKRVKLTGPTGKTAAIPRETALARRVTPAPAAPAQPGETSASATPPADPAAPAFRANQPVQFQGRPARIEAVYGDKATIHVKAGPSPKNPNVNLRGVRLRDVRLSSLSAVEKLAAAPATPPQAPAAPIAPAPTVPAQPADTLATAPQGRPPREIIDELSARQTKQNGFLEPSDRQALAAARENQEREENRRALGANPQPTTEEGKQALKQIRRYEAAREAGATLRASEHANWKNAIKTLEGDFTRQRLALGTKPPGTTDAPAPNEPAAPVTSPTSTPPTAPSAPLDARAASKAAAEHIDRHWDMLTRLGMEDVRYGATTARSGVEFGEDGTLRIDAKKLAASMNSVRELQAKAGVEGTPEDWFSQVLYHEGIHAADIAVAKAKGQDIQERYDALPDEAMPQGWEKAGRAAYGKEFDGLPGWAKKAEFVRMVLEGKWTGKITEQLYKFIRETIAFLKRVAGMEGADPRFKAHVEEVEARVAAIQPKDQAKPRRSFKMPYAPTGTPDVLDHIAEQGGMLSRSKAEEQGKLDQFAGDFDGAPTLGGFYHHAVYGGAMMPDQMAQTLHDNYGVGDGSAEGMWKAIAQAADLRKKVRGQNAKQSTVEKQAGRFDKDALSADTAKGKTQVNTANLAIGDKITVGDQTLTVTGIDPDTLDIELEDHSKYGVQRVADGETLYVEKVEPRDGQALGAARPDTGTRDLFGGDEPFDLRGELAPETERLARAREQQPSVNSRKVAGQPENESVNSRIRFSENENPEMSAIADKTAPSAEGGSLNIGNLKGERINSRRTAFAPEAGSLGIPREQMPQVAAEHRGALANFLKARGVDWQNEEVSPASLKPSQADFNPGKVEKARAYAGDTQRRILVSSDNRVIDGHHQWMGHLAEHPGQPIQVVRLNAPAKDILSQLHEFPSAGMEKAPDIEEAPAPLRVGDKLDLLKDGKRFHTISGDDGGKNVKIIGPTGQPGTIPREMALARRVAPADNLPKLRAGERQGDLLSKQTEDLTLVGEKGIDHAARQAEQEQAERESAAAKAKQDREQGDLFSPRETEAGQRSMGQAPTAGQPDKFDPPAPAERLDEPAKEEKPATDPAAIADFGEKIGGARKDTARPLGPRPKAEAPAVPNAEQPAWRRKYVVAGETKRDYATRAHQPTGRFVVQRADGAHVRAQSFATAAEAEAAIPLIEVGRNHGVSYRKRADLSLDWHIFRKVGEHKRPVVKSGFASEQEAMTHLATHPQEIIEHRFAFPERPWLDRLERTGGTARTGNVTPHMFQDSFGFRGGEFGNWNKGGDGQAALNHAFDALGDLADILGVSPKALSLNGELAIAFGARGTGGENAGAAHYEPGYRVINLTKIKGAGSLAHEWFHALDHYLGRQDGKAKDLAKAEDARAASGRDPAYVRGEYASHGFSRQSQVREALRQAFQEVVNATVAKPAEFTIPAAKLASLGEQQARYVKESLDSLRRQFTEHHVYSRSKQAATPEQLAEFDKLASQIAKGEVGEALHVPAKSGGRFSLGRMSYPAIEQLNALYKDVLGRSFATNEESSLGRKLYWQIGAMKDAQKRVENAAGEDQKQTRNAVTDFLKEARQIDGQRSSDYWSTAHEMGARSFESFVADKLEASERQSDYLVHGTDNRIYAHFGQKPYPEGEERAALNRAWQKVWDVIEEKPTEKGRALYAAAPEDEHSPLTLKEAAPAIRQAIAAKIKAMEKAGEEVPAELRHMGFAFAGGSRAPIIAASNTPAAMRRVLDSLRELDSRLGLNLNLPAADTPGGADLAGVPAANLEKPNEVAHARNAWEKLGTKSPFFRRWFGESKVVDAEGKPLALFHGTQRPGFDRFHTRNGLAYFAENPAYSANFSLGKKDGTYRVYLNVRKPLDLTALGAEKMSSAAFGEHLRAAGVNTDALAYFAKGEKESLNQAPWQYVRHQADLRERIREAGYDGVKQVESYVDDPALKDSLNNQTVAWGVFDPNQIKSAEAPEHPRSNSGEFDPQKPSILLAAAPEAEEAAEPGRIKAAAARLGNYVKHLRSRLAADPQSDRIAAGKDAGETRAGVAAREAGNKVRLKIPDALDRQAAAAAVEAGYNRQKLQEDLASIQASKNPKLAAKYAPIYERALADLPRLQAAAEAYRQIDLREDAAAEKAGLPPSWRKRMQHLFDDPLAPESTIVPDKGFGVNAGYATNAEAIAAGVEPGSMDLADLTEARVRRNQAAINQRALWSELREMKAADGKPILGDVLEVGTKINPDGSVSADQKLPAGYDAVQAGNNVLTVHKDFAPLLRALYGESAIRQSEAGNFLLKAAAFAKHNTLVFDSYHLFRVAAKEMLGFQTTGYKKGLASVEYAPEDLDAAVKAGVFTQEEADYATAARPTVEKLLKAGLNAGKVADNLMEQARAHGLFEKIPLIGPGISKFNHFLFNQFQRGAVIQAGVVAFERNRARFPEMSEAEAARLSAKEVNEWFGNVGNQGFLKSKTMQDLARLVMLAPGWSEGLLRSEVRGVRQAAQAAGDAVRGKGLRAGNVAAAMGGVILASLIANQAVNLFFRGKPTWENEEEGRKLDAWIPGGAQNRGFWFSPLSIAAEYTHAMVKYLEHGESGLDAASHIANNKLSPGARGVKDLLTGKDYAGRPYASMGERVKAAAIDALPSPMPLGAAIEKDPKSPVGYRLNRQPGALQKQMLSTIGVKVDVEPSARSKMYGIAHAYRPAGAGASHPASAYADLRRLLDAEDREGASAEVRRLVTDGGKTVQGIGHALGLRKGGKVATELFTGSQDAEGRMLSKLSPEERKVWNAAQRERRASATLFAEVAAGMKDLLNRDPSGRALALAAVAKNRGNKGLALTLQKSGAIGAQKLPLPAPPQTRPAASPMPLFQGF